MESKLFTYSWGTTWSLPDGKHHRLDGPAVEESNGTKMWMVNGKHHRLDGPAVMYNGGHEEWYINGNKVTYDIHRWAKKFNINLANLSDEDKQMIVLYWS